jgi:MFS transporter, ACS family, tartrate transporter
LLVLAVLPLIAGLLLFLGGHETKAEFAKVNGSSRNPDH